MFTQGVCSALAGRTELRSNLLTENLPDGTLLPVHPAGTFHDGHRIAIEPLN